MILRFFFFLKKRVLLKAGKVTRIVRSSQSRVRVSEYLVTYTRKNFSNLHRDNHG